LLITGRPGQQRIKGVSVKAGRDGSFSSIINERRNNIAKQSSRQTHGY